MDQNQPTAILTRPAGRNTVVMNGLLRRGWWVNECPALEIREVIKDVVDIPQPESFDLIVFVSRAAVTGYQSQLALNNTFDWPQSTLAACMGPVTASVIRRVLGVTTPILHPESGHAQDSEALWPLLMALECPLKKVLIVRGQDGREWLSERLKQYGINVKLHQAYSRQVALWPQQLRDSFQSLQQKGLNPTWLLTSSHSIEAIYKNCIELGLTDWFANSTFVLTHERLRPLLGKLLNRPVNQLQIVIASPEDAVILAAFEELSASRAV